MEIFVCVASVRGWNWLKNEAELSAFRDLELREEVEGRSPAEGLGGQVHSPSTTSIMQSPSRLGTRLATAVCTAMAPPMLCPISMMGGGRSPYSASTTFPTSLQRDSEPRVAPPPTRGDRGHTHSPKAAFNPQATDKFILLSLLHLSTKAGNSASQCFPEHPGNPSFY